MEQPEVSFIDINGRQIACRLRHGNQPTLIFLPGYASDMEGAKAVALDVFAGRKGLSMLRFDYSGTGSSGGEFKDGTLAHWLEEALEAIDQLTDGPLVLIGSSMGGWLALHVALLRAERVRAVVGIAAAPDFTDWGMSGEEVTALQANGRIERPNPYGPEPELITRAFWQSGQEMRLLGAPIEIHCPVRLIHGDEDCDVPLDIAFRTMRALRSSDVQVTIIKGGGHRLSAPHEIDAILRNVAALLEPA